jgi:hypothetical protein
MMMREFKADTLSPEEIDNLYEVMKNSYEESVGSSWSKDKFLDRIKNWIFFGDIDGFVAVRPQYSGPYKLVSTAGNPLKILKGFRLLNAQHKPVWGMVSGDIQKIMHKQNYKTPPAWIIKLMFKKIPPSVFGGVSIEINKDGSATIDYPDVGKSTKYFVANKEYFDWSIDNVELPSLAKKVIKFLFSPKSVETITDDEPVSTNINESIKNKINNIFVI